MFHLDSEILGRLNPTNSMLSNFALISSQIVLLSDNPAHTISNWELNEFFLFNMYSILITVPLVSSLVTIIHTSVDLYTHSILLMSLLESLLFLQILLSMQSNMT